MLQNDYVPDQLGKSLTFPVSKGNVPNGSDNIDNFRGISVCQIISKILEVDK